MRQPGCGELEQETAAHALLLLLHLLLVCVCPHHHHSAVSQPLPAEAALQETGAATADAAASVGLQDQLLLHADALLLLLLHPKRLQVQQAFQETHSLQLLAPLLQQQRVQSPAAGP